MFKERPTMWGRKSKREQEQFAISQWIYSEKHRHDLAELSKHVYNVIRAIDEKGLVPKYHDFVLKKHRDEWPQLWAALDDLRYYVNDKNRGRS